MLRSTALPSVCGETSPSQQTSALPNQQRKGCAVSPSGLLRPRAGKCGPQEAFEAGCLGCLRFLSSLSYV